MSDTPTPAQPAAWRANLRAVWQWMHHGFGALGLLAVLTAAYFYLVPQTALQFGHQISLWVQARAATSPTVVQTAAATQQSQLSAAQQSVADWLARRYSIAPLAMQQLVSRAWQVGQEEHLEPSLILAVMAVESAFNPFAQSAVGATGLMQVMTDVHHDKFVPYGGNVASIDPGANLRVGALVLKNAIDRGGSLREGLRMYVGATTESSSGGYANKVLAEQALLRRIANGAKIPVNVPLLVNLKSTSARNAGAERTASAKQTPPPPAPALTPDA